MPETPAHLCSWQLGTAGQCFPLGGGAGCFSKGMRMGHGQKKRNIPAFQKTASQVLEMNVATNLRSYKSWICPVWWCHMGVVSNAAGAGQYQAAWKAPPHWVEVSLASASIAPCVLTEMLCSPQNGEVRGGTQQLLKLCIMMCHQMCLAVWVHPCSAEVRQGFATEERSCARPPTAGARNAMERTGKHGQAGCNYILCSWTNLCNWWKTILQLSNSRSW